MTEKIILEHTDVVEILTIIGVYDKESIAQITGLYSSMLDANVTNGIFGNFISEACKLANLKLKDWNYSFDAAPMEIKPDPALLIKEQTALERFSDLGKRMRLAQTEYFRTRSSISLKASKKLEKDFDDLVKSMTTPIENPSSTQNTLF